MWLCIHFTYTLTSLKIQLLNHSILLFINHGCISDIPPADDSGYILHKHSPQQFVYLLYLSPDHGLHIIYVIIVIIKKHF